MKRWIGLIFMMPLAVHANTFVGNGGGAGDVELAVTKKQIEEAFRVVKKRYSGEDPESDRLLCKCNGAYANRSVCGPLRSLDDEQRKFCAATLVKQAPEILRLVTNENAVSFRWTDEAIRVADRGETRAVDAVTNREKREITVNLKRFLDLKPFERVFLLTHELMHLTSLDGKPLQDEGAIGPFSGDEGGRRLLNAMGAGAAVMQGEYPSEIKRYRAKLMRSQSWKRFWIDLNFGQANVSKESKNTFASDEFSRTQLTARYALGNFVLVGAYGNEHNDKKVLANAIKVDEDVHIYSFGVGYRIFPFGDPETFWGQSHFLLQVTADYVKADLKLTQVFDDKYTVSTWGGTAALNYYLPIFWGFWGYAGVAYESHPYDYRTSTQNINLKYEGHVLSHYLGVAYAF